MADDDYEIVPEKDLESLRRDVEGIKDDPIGNTAQGRDLKESIDNLNETICKLLKLFTATADQLKSESGDSKAMASGLEPLIKQVQDLTEQNEKIAGGIVSLADMVEELKRKSPPIAQKNIAKTPREPFGPEQLHPQPSFQPQPPFGQQMPPPGMGGGQQPPFPSSQPLPGMQDIRLQPLPRTEIPQMPEPPKQEKRKHGLFGFGK